MVTTYQYKTVTHPHTVYFDRAVNRLGSMGWKIVPNSYRRGPHTDISVLMELTIVS